MDIDGAAQLAWKMMTASDPMPPGHGIDFVREQADVDDVPGETATERCASALYRAAAKWLDALVPNPRIAGVDGDRTLSDKVTAMLAGGAELMASGAVQVIRRRIDEYARHDKFHPDEHTAQRKRWAFWCDTAEEAIALVKQVMRHVD